MLIIRPEQLEVFAGQAEDGFVMRVVRHLRDEYGGDLVRLPSIDFAVERLPFENLREKNEGDFERLPAGVLSIEQLPDELLLEMVRNGIARGCGYGMSWESSLTAFVVLMFVAAPNFDEHPLIQRVLRDEGTAPDDRIDRLWEKTSEANWKTVERDYDASAWSIKPVEEVKKGVGVEG